MCVCARSLSLSRDRPSDREPSAPVTPENPLPAFVGKVYFGLNTQGPPGHGARVPLFASAPDACVAMLIAVHGGAFCTILDHVMGESAWRSARLPIVMASLTVHMKRRSATLLLLHLCTHRAPARRDPRAERPRPCVRSIPLQAVIVFETWITSITEKKVRTRTARGSEH
jgi:hypothetical protein